MLIDAHLHCTGRERSGDVLRSLDEAQVDIAVLLAPFLSDGFSLDDAGSLRRANAHLAELVRGHADRLFGFAVVDPRDPAAADDLRHAVETLGLRGVKMVPTGWYPYDDRVKPVFEVASALRLPVLFHSGIFIDGRSGRFCRPAFFEALRDHPGARVALAHLGWPWTDEAIAVGVIDLINGVPPDQAAFRFDISFGPPPAYRLEVLTRALAVLGAELLQFGSDCFLPCPGSAIAERHGWVVELMEQMQLSPAVRERISSGTASHWLGLREPPPALSVAPATGSEESLDADGGTPDVAFLDVAVSDVAVSNVAVSNVAVSNVDDSDVDFRDVALSEVNLPDFAFSPGVQRAMRREAARRSARAPGWLSRSNPAQALGLGGGC